MSKYEISAPDFREYEDEGPWRSLDLYTEGDTLEELLDSACYFMTDQDGGSLGEREADDDKAQAYIADEFNKQTRQAAAAPAMLNALYQVIETFNPKECNCDGGYGDDGSEGRACYFHRIEEQVRQAIHKAGG